MIADELDFDTPRVSSARVPIFCQVCRKQGRAVYQKGDDPAIAKRGGSGQYKGPTMKLVDYLAGKPRVCRDCEA